MKNLFYNFLLFIVLFFGGCQNKTDNLYEKEQIIWFEKAADEWEEALPIGNGRLGAMVFGNPKNEKIQLNDDSLWPKDIGWEHPNGTADDLKEIREMLFNYENQKVDSMLVKKFSNKTIVRSHQTLGDLLINFEHNNITEYNRSLNLNKAIAKVQYKTDGIQFHKKFLFQQKIKPLCI